MAETILQVVTDTDRRGAQVFATDLHHALVALGRKVDTVALAAGSVGGLDLPTLGPSRRHPRTLDALRRAARGASVVVAHGSTTLPMCALVRPVSHTPFVYRQISESTFWAGSTARRLRVRAALSLASRVVALWDGSAATLETTFGVPRRKIRVVPNGVPPGRFPPIEPDATPVARRALGLDPARPTVLSIGALVPEKGVDVAIRAVGRVERAQLLVAGDGPERSRLEALAADHAPGRVVFSGSVREPRPCFEAADVVVLPSRGGDSMPAVLIEAGLMGVPAIATPVEGIVDILDEGRAGELVTQDDDAGLARAVAGLLDDRTRARALADAARAHCVARYDIAVVAAQWLRVLEEAERRDQR
jgi:glycosyltransferase involved in cell wall biosynthesis